MVRKWIKLDTEPNPDPQNGSFYTVSYKRQRSQEHLNFIHQRRKNQFEYLQTVMSDPVTAYEHEREEYVNGAIRRLSRTFEHSGKERWQLRALVPHPQYKEYAPVIITGTPVNNGNVTPAEAVRKNVTNKKFQLSHRESSKLEHRAYAGDYAIRKFDTGFIQFVRKARLEHDLSQEDLAHMVNVPVSQITLLEKGELMYSGVLKAALKRKLSRMGDPVSVQVEDKTIS